MPAVLSSMTFQGARIRGLSAAIAPDEPMRKAETAGASGGIHWREVTAGDHTADIDDSNNGVAMQSSSAASLIIPNNSTVAFANGTSILILMDNTGVVSISGAPGVTINVRPVFQKRMAGRWAMATVVKRSTNEWVLSGDLEVV